MIPLGPVTLTGQDYVLVESGCVCRPKYAAQNNPESSAIPTIPRIWTKRLFSVFGISFIILINSMLYSFCKKERR